MSVKLLTEHHLEFLSLTGGCTGSSETTLVKIPPCWKSHVMAHNPTMSFLLMILPFAVLTGLTLHLYLLFPCLFALLSPPTAYQTGK